MTGEVKWYDARKRYGFILPDGVAVDDKQAHVFVHESVLEQPLRAGQEVEYALIPGSRTPKALWVKVLNKRSYVPINEGRKAVANGD
jgi:cold shock CspA family protein